MANRQDHYTRISNQARTEEAGGLPTERSVLLLWYLRNVMGLDSLDAYDFVCDGGDDWGVDGLYLEKDEGDTDREQLVVLQSKYTEKLREMKKRDVEALIATGEQFKSAANVTKMMAGPIEPALARLINDFGLVRKLGEGRLADGRLRLQLVLVTTGFLTKHARNVAGAANAAADRNDYLLIEDVDKLGPIAEAVDLRLPLTTTLTASVPKNQVLAIGKPGERVGIAPVRAHDMILWPGIADRSLFDLNVRRALPRNQVRQELDAAIERRYDHPNFLAYHNGLTIICDSFRASRGRLRIENPSVVNGAQSVVAFSRKASKLTPDLRIFVKLVEVKGRPALAREVSRRSNTQNPVNARMLMANSGPQMRITEDFKAHFSDIEYITKPDEALKPKGRYINNDDAAQLLCAIFVEQPWLAVKRASLFLSDNHALIFRRDRSAAHVVLADEIGLAVDRGTSKIPAFYQGSWRLTRIVMAYLVGQVLRAGEEDGEQHHLISDPASAFDTEATVTTLTGTARAWLDDAVSIAAFALRERFGSLGEKDDYKKDFKNEGELRRLGASAETLYKVRGSIPPAPLMA